MDEQEVEFEEDVLRDDSWREDDALLQSEHQYQVERLLKGIGQPVRETPGLPNDKTLVLSARLNLEEVLETIDAMGIEITLDPNYSRFDPIKFSDLVFTKAEHKTPNLVEIVDGFADVMVTAVGGLSFCGVKDEGLLREVNNNNLLKLQNGKLDPVTNKFIKPPNHPRPDIEGVLKDQGWEGSP